MSRATAAILFATILAAGVPAETSAQLSGSYTIGGDSPDYSSFEQATAALETSGVAGAVAFLVRPGVYEQAGGSERVIDIPNPISGASDQNSVTFRPDPASGGEAENIILRRRSGVSDGRSDGYIARIRSGFVHIERFTFVVADSSLAPTDQGGESVGSVIEFDVPGIAPADALSVLGTVIEGLEGRCFIGVRVNSAGRDVKVLDNDIRDCREAIGIYGGTAQDALVSGNRIRGLRRWFSGQSVWRGDGIRVQGSGSGITVTDNDIEYLPGTNSGVQGIVVQGAPTDIVVVGNRVAGNRVGGDFGSYTGIYIREAIGGLVANNMVTSAAATSFGRANWGLYMLTTEGLRVVHNTVVHPGSSPSRVLYLNGGPGHEVRDNILISAGGQAMWLRGTDVLGQNTFDYNVLHSGSPPIVREGSLTRFETFDAWQQTGHGQNSVNKLPEFQARFSDLHLAGCSVADESLRGTPQPDVTLDFDGELRDLIMPFMGMDEAAGEVPELFGTPANYGSGNSSWQFAAGDLDGDGDEDLAISNTPAGSEDVTVLWNDGNGVFSEPTHVHVGSDPGVVKIGQMNNDGVLDLVVSVTDSVVVAYGSATGSFSPPMALVSADHVHLRDRWNGTFPLTDFELAHCGQDGLTDIFMLMSPPNDSASVVTWVSELVDVLPEPLPSSFQFKECGRNNVGQYGDDLVVADLNDDGLVDFAIVDATQKSALTTSFGLGNDPQDSDANFSTPVEQLVNVFSRPADPNFLVGDFDGDLDVDLVLGDQSDIRSLVLLRNNGDGTFAEREPIFVHRTRTPRVSAALDYDGDGDLDIVTGNNTNDTHTLLNDGTGAFELFVSCDGGEPRELAGLPRALVVAPLDGDASPDVAALTLADTVAVLTNLMWRPSGVSIEEDVDQPSGFSLHNNYPNPFNPSTTIRYSLPEAANASVEVYDITGRLVVRLADGWHSAGEHHVRFDGRGLASGVYVYRLRAGTRWHTEKMLLLK